MGGRTEPGAEWAVGGFGRAGRLSLRPGPQRWGSKEDKMPWGLVTG